VAVSVSWHFVAIALTGFGVLLFASAGRSHSSERTVVLATVAGICAAVAIMTAWLARRRPVHLLILRSPIPGLVAVALLCALSA
jgi:hypothetical protein